MKLYNSEDQYWVTDPGGHRETNEEEDGAEHRPEDKGAPLVPPQHSRVLINKWGEEALYNGELLVKHGQKKLQAFIDSSWPFSLLENW